MINVTKTYLPPFESYTKRLKEIWDSGWITNNGHACRELEDRLAARLNVKHVILVNNGTIALQIAIKALELKDTIITTPFSYVATTSSISWEGATPLFADIDSATWNIAPTAIERAEHSDVSGILATHVFGNPCDVVAIDQIASRHGQRVIYDGAHAFDVEVNGTSVFNYGDCTTLSFHATKLFHTVEGGAIVCADDEVAHRCRYMRNFGHNGKEEFWGIGVNGKISEVHAAMGLCMLEHIEDIVTERQELSARYDRHLQPAGLQSQELHADIRYNYAYYPTVFPTEQALKRTIQSLNEHDIFPRRYFYPSLNTLPYVEYQSCPNSESISSRIACLPLYNGLKPEEIDLICEVVLNSLKG